MINPRRTLLAGLPITERRLRIGSVMTSVLEAGEGSPLVLLHGGIEIGGAYWAPLIPALAQRYRVIVPDVPGLGESDPLVSGPLDHAQFNAWFNAALDQLCTEPPALVAHSLLGSYSAAYASRHRDCLRALAIYGAPGIAAYRMPLGLMVAAILFDLHPSMASQARFLPWAFRDPAATQALHPDWFHAFNLYCVERGRVPHVKRTMRQLVRHGTRRVPDQDLAGISIPTSLLWGGDDRMVSLRVAESAAAAHGWPLHVIANAGHVPHLEQPDAFLQTLSAAFAEPALVQSGGAR
jgi:pimeloyl-ACP methyl ester carboxylesterase